MENWQVALLIVAALYVGIRIPMLIQFQMTLRSVDRLIRANESEVRRTVMELSQFSAHLNRLGESVGSNGQHVKKLFESIEGLAEGISHVRGTLRTASLVGATVAPAIGAAIKAWQSRDGESDHAAALEALREEHEAVERELKRSSMSS